MFVSLKSGSANPCSPEHRVQGQRPEKVLDIGEESMTGKEDLSKLVEPQIGPETGAWLFSLSA